MSARSKTIGEPLASLPRNRGMRKLSNFRSTPDITSPSRTTWRWSLGTSMPTVVCPGIGATMRTLGTARAIARSSARLMIFETAQAGFQLDLELGDHRAGIDLHDADLVAEIQEGPLQEHRPSMDLGLVLLDREGRRRLEQVHRRQFKVRSRRGHYGRSRRLRRRHRCRSDRHARAGDRRGRGKWGCDGRRVALATSVAVDRDGGMDPGLRRGRGIRQDHRIVPIAPIGPDLQRCPDGVLDGFAEPATEPSAGLLDGPGDQDVVAERQADERHEPQGQGQADIADEVTQEERDQGAEVAAAADRRTGPDRRRQLVDRPGRDQEDQEEADRGTDPVRDGPPAGQQQVRRPGAQGARASTTSRRS